MLRDGTVISSSLREGSGNAEFSLQYAKEAAFFLDVTALAGTTPGATVSIEGKDSASGNWFELVAFTAVTGVTNEAKWLTSASAKFLTRTARVKWVETGTNTAAALSTALAGANNDLDYTAVTAGSVGNAITIRYLNTGAPSQALACAVVGSAITVTLATDAGTAAALSTALVGLNNDLDYTATAVGVAGNSTTIEYIDPAAISQALSVTISGTTDIKVHLATDGAGAITSTATEVKAAIDALPAAAALVSVANTAANDGSGVVTAMATTPLAGGLDPAITSTATNVKTVIDGTPAAAALVTVANKAANDGSGLVIAMAATPLAGGANLSMTFSVGYATVED